MYVNREEDPIKIQVSLKIRVKDMGIYDHFQQQCSYFVAEIGVYGDEILEKKTEMDLNKQNQNGSK